ncbi:MAG: lipoate--protein ligase [Bacteroidota bacterium]|nr:lipoate--protein ligase [Bacteroidota bacterium]
MLCINSTSGNPYFNLAAEEFLLRKSDQDIFMLYINEPSIVVGKHQNALSEINLDFVNRNNIKVARRLSGGGTVFHDFGNLNFCFIQTAKDKNLVNFSKYMRPIINVLKDLGLETVESKHNDILINGLKISGNAEHVFKKRVLHHGTLLFDSKLDKLREALKVSQGCFTDRSVQSRRSKVANIVGFLKHPVSIENFRMKIFNHQLQSRSSAQLYVFSEEDLKEIELLVVEKFSTWDWNFGYSPKYEFRNSTIIQQNKYEVLLNVEKGYIQQASFFKDGKEDAGLRQLSVELVNLRHFPNDIKKCLEFINVMNNKFILSNREIKYLLH